MRKKIVIESLYLYNYHQPDSGITVGGTQRYALDLGKLFYDNGYDVIYITKANTNSDIMYEEWARIVAFDSPYGERGRRDFSKRVYSFCEKIKPDLVFYSDIMVALPYCYDNSFGIQHGIGWDNPHNKIKNILKGYFYLKAIHKFKRIICVDTNFINWVRERDKIYFSNPEQLIYVPNYADENQFNYQYKEWNSNEKIKLFYARRLVAHRGFEIFMEMCKALKDKGYNIEPILAFEDFRENDFKNQYPQYNDIDITVVHPSMNKIHEYYRQAYLSFVPTKWSEGTSLSAIESISTGCPVIASDVGGLGNIILPGFNGYIVPPSTNEFISVTEMLIKNPDKRNELSRNCKSMNQVFGKKRWERQIIEAIREFI